MRFARLNWIMDKKAKNPKNTAVAITIGVLVVLVLVLALAVELSKDTSQAVPDGEFVIAKGKRSEPQAFMVAKGSVGAVATDDKRCSKAGLEVLKGGGNAVDAAVASLLCLGVVNFQSSGIGGGLMMLVAKNNTSSVTVIDAREVAPNSSRESDYMPVNPWTGKHNYTSDTGTLSIAIPGELRGMEMALDLFSNNTKAKRQMIFETAIEFAKHGFSPSWHLLNAIDKMTTKGIVRFEKNPTFNHSNLRDLVTSCKSQNWCKRPCYANTLKEIVENGFQEFYNGTTAKSLVNDINNAACMELPSKYCNTPYRITMEQWQSYNAIRRDPLQFAINGSANVMYTAPAPASGSALALFLGIMQERISEGDNDIVKIYHYLLEASKFSNSHLMDLGDPAFNPNAHVAVANVTKELESILNKSNPEYAHPNDSLEYYNYMAGPSESNTGTTHVVVATSNGDVVSVTSTINDYFGSGFLSNLTGVILNDQMDDFYVPANDENRFRYNHVEGGKRPLSSATPAIMTDSNGNLRLALGASGGRRIPPAVGQSAFFIINRGESVDKGINRARVFATLDKHGTTIKEEVENSDEHYLTSEVRNELNTTYRHYNFDAFNGISVVQGIALEGSTFCAYSDPRKEGAAAAYPSSNNLVIQPRFIHTITCLIVVLSYTL